MDNNNTPGQYIPYGPEWEKEMMKFTKAGLIKQLSKVLQREAGAKADSKTDSAGSELSYAELNEECKRLADLADYWQNKYYEAVPPSFQRPKLDNL